MTADRTCQSVALLVGSNPLPNYLAVTVLQPRTVVLLYSPETREPRDRLRDAFRSRGIEVQDICIDDATDARKIRDRCQSLQVDHLHYSGGTKPMAAHARMAFAKGDEHSSYLDERRGRLRFDDGYEIELDRKELGLTLDVLLRLHGIERRAPRGPVERGPAGEDVEAVAKWVFDEPDRAQEPYDHFRRDGKPQSVTWAKANPFRAADRGLEVTASVIPGADWASGRYERWEEFLTGGWLECWIANRIVRSCPGVSASDVEVSVKCERTMTGTRAEFEIDVAVVRGHRLYVVSCTTARKKSRCKSKLFEVAMRSRQMGGDLARCALVCLLDAGDHRGPYVEQLRADIVGLWDAPNVPRVFGLADLGEWTGLHGTPNLATLTEWLGS